jgi:hypothetical protein
MRRRPQISWFRFKVVRIIARTPLAFSGGWNKPFCLAVRWAGGRSCRLGWARALRTLLEMAVFGPRTTKLYNCNQDQITLTDAERSTI